MVHVEVMMPLQIHCGAGLCSSDDCQTMTILTGCRTMVSQLLVHQRIETTLPRAKELRRLADRVVTISKEVQD